MRKYSLKYEWCHLATVEIDPDTAESPIREMVQFWSGWGDRLAAEDGDYTRAFLKQLALHILANGRAPLNEEGWSLLDGSEGITVKEIVPFEFDNELISVHLEEA